MPAVDRSASSPEVAPAAPSAEPAEHTRVNVRDDVLRALARTGYACLEQIEVRMPEPDLVLLAGRVPSYYLKQLAQETILHIAREYRVLNQLTVVIQTVTVCSSLQDRQLGF